MRPARANKEKERITKATNTSINVNPLDFNNGFNRKSPFLRISYTGGCKTYTNRFYRKKGGLKD